MEASGGLSAVDLTVVIVSFNDASWLPRCLQSLRRQAGVIDFEVVLVDNGSDGAGELTRRQFPDVHAVQIENRGFGNGNNVGAMSGSGRYVLFLNPDTELVRGTLRELIDALDRRPEVGLAGVRQMTADGTLWPTIRYFPNAVRALGDALGCERWPRRPRWAGERELDPALYEVEVECDWTSGSFMLARREALLSAGLFDERFFLYAEEPDLCLRIKRAGWAVRHLPLMTIVHHARKAGIRPELSAQEAFARAQYARKHFAAPHRGAYLTALGAGHLLRAGLHADGQRSERQAAARLALRTLLGVSEPPFGPPPHAALIRSGRSAG